MSVSKVILLLVFTSLHLCIRCAPATRTFIVKRYRVNADELNEVIPQSSRVIQSDDQVLNAVMDAVRGRSPDEQSNVQSSSDDEGSKFQSKVMGTNDDGDARYLARQPLVLPYPNTMAPGAMFPPAMSHAIAPPLPPQMSPVASSGYQETTRVTSHSSSSSSINDPHAPGFVRETSYKEIHRTSGHPNIFNSGGNVPSSMHPGSWDRSSPADQAQSNGDVFLSLTPPLVFSLNLG